MKLSTYIIIIVLGVLVIAPQKAQATAADYEVTITTKTNSISVLIHNNDSDGSFNKIAHSGPGFRIIMSHKIRCVKRSLRRVRRMMRRMKRKLRHKRFFTNRYKRRGHSFRVT